MSTPIRQEATGAPTAMAIIPAIGGRATIITKAIIASQSGATIDGRSHAMNQRCVSPRRWRFIAMSDAAWACPDSVSYTPLTLPTNDPR